MRQGKPFQLLMLRSYIDTYIDTPNTPKYLQLTLKTQTNAALTGVIPSICSC